MALASAALYAVCPNQAHLARATQFALVHSWIIAEQTPLLRDVVHDLMCAQHVLSTLPCSAMLRADLLACPQHMQLVSSSHEAVIKADILPPDQVTPSHLAIDCLPASIAA